VFRNRVEAGTALGEALVGRFDDDDVVVLGLPRGGVPVAFEVAKALGAPLDVVLVRKLGLPGHRELAMGAIGEGGIRVLDPEVMAMAGVGDADLERVEASEREVLAQRAQRFRAGRPRVDLTGRTAVVVDDGVATGSTARAACRIARAHGATRVVLAVPVAPPDVEARFADEADEVVALRRPSSFRAVGQFYDDFTQVDDDEVVAILARA
jgi:predicted phosphoribosyltransferase